MTNPLNEFLESRNEALPRVADGRGDDGNPTTAADVTKNSPPNTFGAFQSQSQYQRVDWDTPVPVLALTPTGDRIAQSRSPTGFLEVLSMTIIRGDPSAGIRARNAAGQMTDLVPRTLLGV